MPLTTEQIERLRTLTGHPALTVVLTTNDAEHEIEDYISVLDMLAENLQRRADADLSRFYDRHRRRLCDKLLIKPGPTFSEQAD